MPNPDKPDEFGSDQQEMTREAEQQQAAENSAASVASESQTSPAREKPNDTRSVIYDLSDDVALRDEPERESVLGESTTRLKNELKRSLKQQKELLQLQQEQLEQQQEQQKMLQQQTRQLQMQQQALQLQTQAEVLQSESSNVNDVTDDEDEEIRMAKALAMAIAQNPNMTADQIQKLVQAQNKAAEAAGVLPTAPVSPSSKSSSSSVFKKAGLTKLQGSLMSSGMKAQNKITSILKTAEKSISSGAPTKQVKDFVNKSVKSSTSKSSSSKSASNKNSVKVLPKDINKRDSLDPGTGDSVASKKKPTTSPSAAIKAGSKSVSKTMKSAMGSLSAATPKTTASSEGNLTTTATSTSTGSQQASSKKGTLSTSTPKPVTAQQRVRSDSGSGSLVGLATAEQSSTPEPSAPAYQLQDTPMMDSSDQAGEEEDMLPKHSPIRITGVVWKRRSGLGKYSVSAAWERRRIVLKGTKLFYYRNLEDNQLEEDTMFASADEDLSEDDDGAAASVAEKQSWLEQYTAKATAAVAQATTGVVNNYGVGSTSSGKSGRARGHLDLIKEQASVGASLGHSGAPTPFALSIKVLAQTKWKLCFDTHLELMQWLAALTDVVVQGSVDDYNAQILQANDPSYEASLAFSGQLSEPPPIGSNGGKEGVGGHRLWVMGPYSVQSYDTVSDEMQEEEELQTDDEEEYDRVEEAATSTRELEVEKSLVDDATTPSNTLIYVVLTVNAAVTLSRASSTTVETFWYIVIFSNLLLIACLTKQKEIYEERQLRSLAPTVQRSTRKQRNLSTQQQHSIKSEITGDDSTKPPTSSPDALVEPDFKPIAGTTTMRIENETDTPVKDGQVYAGWRVRTGDAIAVRSHGYLTTKKKIPSPGSLYECVQVDIFESERRVPDMAARVTLPKVEFDDGDLPKTWNAPDVFVISIAIPTEQPKLGWSVEDGGGYTVTLYFTMLQETRDILRKVTADDYDSSSEKVEDVQKSKLNAVRLLDEWCRRAPTDDKFMARFKVVPNAQNLKEIGLPTWISKYNGKPFLIKRPGQTGFLYRHPEKSCMEFDVSLHPFPYIAKQGICFMKDTYFKKVLVTFGFLIEGRSDDELPECLIGLMQLCYPDPAHAIQANDFFSGRSPMSFKPDEGESAKT